MKSLGLPKTNLEGKCGECKKYTPLKSINRGELTEYSKGTCKISGRIVQRSDKKCKKNFESNVNNQGGTDNVSL